MLDLYQFNQLGDNEKYQAVMLGMLLDIRKQEDLIVQLYRIDDFYAEVFYDPVENMITCISGSRSNSILAKYISL